LLLYSSHLALGVSNWPVIYFINYTPTSSLTLFITAPSTSFSGAVAGEEEDFCKGSFRMHILYFVLSFALLYFYLHHFIKNPKKLVSFIVVISLL
jgi:hypothetical protein